MNLVEFFGTVIKPKKVKGKKMMFPKETSKLDDKIFFIRDKDVNAFLIKSNNGYIAIDTGYKNSKNMRDGLDKLKIDPKKVLNVFLTHVDLDHAGGLDKRCDVIYPNAQVYLGEIEAKYLTKELARKKILGIKLASPISLNPNYILVKHHDKFEIDGVTIEAILTPGHTLGHLSYIVDDKYLFVGDTLILNQDGGYCFWDFWNIDSKMNMKSLFILFNIAKKKKIKYIITSHNGYTNSIEHAFKNIYQTLEWRKRGFVFNPDAPFDPYN